MNGVTNEPMKIHVSGGGGWGGEMKEKNSKQILYC